MFEPTTRVAEYKPNQTERNDESEDAEQFDRPTRRLL